jgi:hypothetical protein
VTPGTLAVAAILRIAAGRENGYKGGVSWLAADHNISTGSWHEYAKTAEAAGLYRTIGDRSGRTGAYRKTCDIADPKKTTVDSRRPNQKVLYAYAPPLPDMAGVEPPF